MIDIRLVLQWEPSKLELISNEMVDKYFAKVDDEVWEDLKLPYRPTRTSRLWQCNVDPLYGAATVFLL